MPSRLRRWLHGRRPQDELLKIPLFMGVYKDSYARGDAGDAKTSAAQSRPHLETVRTRRIELVNAQGRTLFTISASRDGAGVVFSNATGGSMTISPSEPEVAVGAGAH